MFKFGPVKAVALSASGTNSLQWKRVILQVPLSTALQAEPLGGMSRVFVHDQRFLEFTGHKNTQLDSILPQGLCAGYIQENGVTGQGK